MNKNFLLQSFLIVLALAASGYSIVAGYGYFQYSRLKENTLATDVRWSVREINDEKYVPEGQYTFSVNGQLYSGGTPLYKEIYRNRAAAENSLSKYIKQSWLVWYSPSNPAHSSLEKRLPLKNMVSSAVLWGIFFYFFWLAYYIRRLKV